MTTFSSEEFRYRDVFLHLTYTNVKIGIWTSEHGSICGSVMWTWLVDCILWAMFHCSWMPPTVSKRTKVDGKPTSLVICRESFFSFHLAVHDPRRCLLKVLWYWKDWTKVIQVIWDSKLSSWSCVFFHFSPEMILLETNKVEKKGLEFFIPPKSNKGLRFISILFPLFRR